MKNAVINGTGSYLPKRQLSNFELESKLDTTHEWIHSRTGISSRYIADEQETVFFMASEAARNAIESSTIDADDIDVIIVATCTPDHFFPSMACHVQKALNIKKPIPAFDISAACSGFVYAMDTAWNYIRSGAAKHVLVIGSERMSHAVNWEDRSTCILFGDGAGAVVLSADSEKEGIIASKLHSSFDADGLLTYENFTTAGQRSYVGMRGNEVFKIAVNIMGDIVDEILEASQLEKSDINWLIPHQANIRIIRGIAKKLNLPMSQVIVTIENQGNTSAASIPLALDFAIKNGSVKRDELLLLESFGAGMTWGALVIRY
ncbi:3-oxoacyl-ACP synthase [Legionella birminghamensis]|uniref:Beta-ketoacyl-[acyl-carrier-protein] synthase III n=1 Tax=Legionella birminghamensis TaxID=28083 RepID=A0A378IA43_9GAMM|nr:beta-ketoacyl-ACP synthase III [Legionella birminghamensis]KTC74379.1 3-oxoacyl-ACP synthase [Legionella birminghamensis]STX31706.1 3-oxoacyl-(acyl-carrier-protein) [Legionella birminghamensis]